MGLGAVAAAAGRRISGAETASVRFGCQTNAWRVNPANLDSLYAAVDKIAELGFAGFETGFRNLQAPPETLPAIRQRLERSALKFYGVHIFLGNRYDPDTHIAPVELYEKVAQTGAALGAQRLILSGAPAPDEESRKRKTDGLNRAGAYAAKLGLGLAYHNHWPEFDNGGAEIRALLAGTDPRAVGFLLDAGHAFRSGADVPAFVAANQARLAGLHLRDFAAKKQVPLGQGEFPLAQVAAALKQANWQGWVLAEEEREDGSKPGETAAAPALAALRKAFAA